MKSRRKTSEQRGPDAQPERPAARSGGDDIYVAPSEPEFIYVAPSEPEFSPMVSVADVDYGFPARTADYLERLATLTEEQADRLRAIEMALLEMRIRDRSRAMGVGAVVTDRVRSLLMSSQSASGAIHSLGEDVGRSGEQERAIASNKMRSVVLLCLIAVVGAFSMGVAALEADNVVLAGHQPPRTVSAPSASELLGLSFTAVQERLGQPSVTATNPSGALVAYFPVVASLGNGSHRVFPIRVEFDNRGTAIDAK